MIFYPSFASKEQRAADALAAGAGARVLPFLVQPKEPVANAGPHEDWIERVCTLFLDSLRQTLSLMTSSVAALAAQADAHFSQLSALLAFDRAAKSLEECGFRVWPKQQLPAVYAFNPWAALFASPPFSSLASQWLGSPAAFFGGWSAAYANCFNPWTPAAPPPVARPLKERPRFTDRPTFTATFSMPGFTWSVTCDQPASHYNFHSHWISHGNSGADA